MPIRLRQTSLKQSCFSPTQILQPCSKPGILSMSARSRKASIVTQNISHERGLSRSQQRRTYFTSPIRRDDHHSSSIIEQNHDRTVNDSREKVVILGSGWAGYVLSRNLDPNKYRILVVSPRSYFVFTPLLNDTAVGTLEFRHALESVRKTNSQVEFIQGWADDVNFADKTVTIEPSILDPDVGHALTGPRRPDTSTSTPQPGRGYVLQKIQLGGTGTTRVPTFPVQYDKLVIAVGCYSQTFNTKGVRENAMFLKDVGDARRIRRRVLEVFELAGLPFVPEEAKKCLLHFAVVGGGPTGMEFAACLSDLIRDEISKLHPQLMKYIQISLFDVAPKVLPMFDATLADYAVRQYSRKNIQIKTSHHVEELRKGFPDDIEAREHQDKEVKGRIYTLRTKEEGDIGIGMCVWSTGLMANPFVQKALDHVRRFPVHSAEITQGSEDLVDGDDKMKRRWVIDRDPRSGSILVDDHFRVHLSTNSEESSSSSSTISTSNNPKQNSTPPSTDSTSPSPTTEESKATMHDVFALGDTAKLPLSLPATAQVANQQALWLAKALNTSHHSRSDFSASKGFTFRNLGVMTYLGGAKAVIQGPPTNSKNGKARGIKGLIAFWMWRGAYLTMTLSWRNKFLIPVQWFAVRVFGRDVSRF